MGRKFYSRRRWQKVISKLGVFDPSLPSLFFLSSSAFKGLSKEQEKFIIDLDIGSINLIYLPYDFPKTLPRELEWFMSNPLSLSHDAIRSLFIQELERILCFAIFNSKDFTLVRSLGSSTKGLINLNGRGLIKKDG